MPELAPALQQQITQATASLAEAERALAEALQKLRHEERADKVMIGTALEAAFERLSAAKVTLANLLASD